MKNKDYCDHCGKIIPTGKAYAVSSLPVNIDSANVGESAILCKACYGGEMKKQHNNSTRIVARQRKFDRDVIEEKWMGFAHSILSQQMSTEEFFSDVDCIDITVQDRVSDFIVELGDWQAMGWKEENNARVLLARYLFKEFK